MQDDVGKSEQGDCEIVQSCAQEELMKERASLITEGASLLRDGGKKRRGRHVLHPWQVLSSGELSKPSSHVTDWCKGKRCKSLDWGMSWDSSQQEAMMDGCDLNVKMRTLKQAQKKPNEVETTETKGTNKAPFALVTLTVFYGTQIVKRNLIHFKVSGYAKTFTFFPR